jgi:hypothetical protein
MKRTVLVLFEITWDDSGPGNWTSECTLDGDVEHLYRAPLRAGLGTDLVHQFAYAIGNMAARKRWDPLKRWEP